MSLQHTLLKASLGLGSMGLVGLTLLGTVQTNPAVAASRQISTSVTAQPEANQPNNLLLSQGRGQGQSQGQGRGQGDCQGHGPRDEHFAEAAAQLGVSEAALRSALGVPDQRPERPDLAAVASQLGTTEDELRTSLRDHMQAQRQDRRGEGPHAGPPDFTALAQQYGVSEAEFRRIMGIPDRPDLATAAAQLGVTEEALQDALRSAHGNRGPGGHPGNGRGPGTNPGNAGGGR